MNKRMKIGLVRKLAKHIVSEVVEAIRNESVPEEWDGFELRRYLADKFEESTYPMDPRRQKAYRNTIAVSRL